MSLIAGRSVLREEEEDLRTQRARSARRHTTLIGNVQWRFTPSPRLTISQQAYVLHARYSNQVADGRTREEGSDLDLTWRRRCGVESETGPPHRVRGQRAGARRRAHRPPILGSVRSHPARCYGDARSGAGWVQYRWTPAARFSVTPGVRVEHWRAPRNSQNTRPHGHRQQLYESVAVASHQARNQAPAARPLRRWYPAPGADDRSVVLHAAR